MSYNIFNIINLDIEIERTKEKLNKLELSKNYFDNLD